MVVLCEVVPFAPVELNPSVPDILPPKEFGKVHLHYQSHHFCMIYTVRSIADMHRKWL